MNRTANQLDTNRREILEATLTSIGTRERDDLFSAFIGPGEYRRACKTAGNPASRSGVISTFQIAKAWLQGEFAGRPAEVGNEANVLAAQREAGSIRTRHPDSTKRETLKRSSPANLKVDHNCLALNHFHERPPHPRLSSAGIRRDLLETSTHLPGNSLGGYRSGPRYQRLNLGCSFFKLCLPDGSASQPATMMGKMTLW